ncbi:MAG: SBBP repeat-containing protein [Bacteroidetes bacterium]|nr:SBBP repeat-containing protein [Bacteroidota bacterium]
MKSKITLLASAILLIANITFSTVSLAQVTQEWASRYNGPGSADDHARSIVMDGSGNVYVTGYSAGYGNSDYSTIKYDALGAQQWVAIYSGPGNGNDAASSIVVDGMGNVYVTGNSLGNGTGTDYATIKYNSSGVEQWVARYNGPGNGSDGATSIAVDGSGNVYVTGGSMGSGTSGDYATIKYDPMGVEQWAARYNGPQGGQDGATSLKVDSLGNVYVTGTIQAQGVSSDYATVKYNSMGVEQWAVQYNGPQGYIDNATSIAVDDFGNTYVTGNSRGTGTVDDYATIKYNSSGVEQWVARYNGPGNGSDVAYSLAVDDSGNVFVTGRSTGSGTGYDYATIKYNSSGVQQWASRYNGIGNSNDEAYSLTVDGSGNVYVTGKSAGGGTAVDYATIKYNSLGVQQWASRYNGTGNDGDAAFSLALDGLGNVFVTGESDGVGTLSDYATIKYDSTGILQWVTIYDGNGSAADGASSLAVDNMGNVYVTGESWGGVTGLDYATIKYNASGIQQWVARYDGPGNGWDHASSIAVDGSGNVYVTGYSTGNGTYLDYATIKYDPSGVQQWVARYNGSGNDNDFAFSLTVDGSGNVYVTGRMRGGPGTSDDYATIKYNSSGVQQWVKIYNGPGNDNDDARAVAVDNAGNVYVTGGSAQSGTAWRDYATIKYNSLGVQQWVKRYNGQANFDDFATSLAVDTSGNVYVTGFSVGTGTNNDYATIKYNSMGDTLWIERYNGPGNYIDEARSVSVDGTGNVYVTGKSLGNGTGDDYATIKYDSTGVEQWVERYNGPGNGSDGASKLVIDNSGNVYVTGSSAGSGTGNDFATIKYDASGVELWVERYNGPANGSDGASSIALDGMGNVYVTGGSFGGPTANDYATIKYSQPLGIPTLTSVISLFQLFPNPATNTFTIALSSISKKVHVTIADITGKVIYSTTASEIQQVEVNTNDFAAGVYVVQIQTGDFIATKKLVIEK